MAHLIPKLVYGSISPTEIEFAYPPAEDDGESYNVVSKEAESISGVQQVSVSYTEATRRVRLSFLSDSLKTALKAFFTSHGGLGKPFKWYDDKEESDYSWYALAKRQFEPKKLAWSSGAFIWELDFEFRRVFDLVGEFDMSVAILNNQSSPVSIAGLLISSAADTSMIVFYELRRKTDDSEAVATGTLELVYRESTSTWEMNEQRNGDDCDVQFSITSPAGQVQYTTDAMAGANYTGEIIFKGISLND